MNNLVAAYLKNKLSAGQGEPVYQDSEAILQHLLKQSEEAKQDYGRDVGLAGFGRAMQTINEGLTGVKPDEVSYKAQIEKAQSDRSAKQNLIANYMKQKLADQQRASEHQFQERLADKQILAGLIGKQGSLEAAKAAESKKGTLGQQTADREFGKEYSNWVASGGSTAVEANITKLEEAIESLKKNSSATGWVVGNLPRKARELITPDGVSIQDKVEFVIQQSLKQILGGAFSKEEAAQLIARSYNPSLPEEENIKRLQATAKQLREMVKAKDRAIKEYESKGSIKGLRADIGGTPSIPRPKQVSEEDWVKATDEEKQQLSEMFQ